MSLIVRVIIAICCGAILSLAFPGVNLSLVVWVWMLPLLPLIWKGERKRYGFGIAYCAGLGFWLINLKWIWTVSGIGAIALSAFLALYFGLWGIIAVTIGNPWRKRLSVESEAESSIQKRIDAKLTKSKKQSPLGIAMIDARHSLKFAFINAAAWVGIEWLRGWLFTGFGWNGLGVAFHNTPLLTQAADLVGVTGLAFTPVFLSAVIVQSINRMRGEIARGKLRPKIDFGVAVLILALQFCYGIWRVNQVHQWKTQPVRVVLIQENIPQDLKWDELAALSIMDGYAESTRQAMRDLDKQNEALMENPEGEVELLQPDLVIWPESAIPYPIMFSDDLNGKQFTDATGHLINEEVRSLGGFTLITGMNEVEVNVVNDRLYAKEGGKVYNTIVTIPPGGSLEDTANTHRKSHLVVFGEYIPLKDKLPFLAKLFQFSSGQSFAGNMDAGDSTEPVPLQTASGEVQMIPSVCFEDTVGRLARKFVRKQPQVIVNLTNDGWFGESEAAAQHMANAKFRAIELRRPMIRSANTGMSAIISATGSLTARDGKKRLVVEDKDGNHFTKGQLYGEAHVPIQGGISLYAAVGDAFSWLMIGCTGLFFIRSLIGAKK